MSDVTPPDSGSSNVGDEPAAESSAEASEAYEKGEQQEHEAEAKDPGSNAGDEPGGAEAAFAYEKGEQELHQAEAKDPGSNAGDQPEGAEAAKAYEAGEGELAQAEHEVAWSNAGVDHENDGAGPLAAEWGNAGLQGFTPVYPRPIPPPLQVGLRLNQRVALNVWFTVTIDTVDLGAWSKCTGLGMKIDYEDRKESGMTLFQHHLPGHLIYEHITLERPLTPDSRAVMGWFLSFQMLPIPTSGIISCYNHVGDTEPVMTWEMTGITPVSWKGPSMDATGTNNAATETLTFAHQGFL